MRDPTKQTKRDDPANLIGRHRSLIHSENKKVNSHRQRVSGEWFLNTLILEDVSVPFKYKRKKRYRDLQGARVNITYYADTEEVAGIQIDVMRVVRLLRA